MFNKFKSMLTICLLAFASMQTAQAVAVYNSASAVAGTDSAPASFSTLEQFEVTGGSSYLATLTDIGTVFLPVIDNFDALSMVILDDTYAVVGSPLLLAPTSGSGPASVSFTFTALSDAFYSVVLGGTTDALSTYTATIMTVSASPVPVPGAIWFLGTGMFALVGFGRRKSA